MKLIFASAVAVSALGLVACATVPAVADQGSQASASNGRSSDLAAFPAARQQAAGTARAGTFHLYRQLHRKRAAGTHLAGHAHRASQHAHQVLHERKP